VVDAARRAGNAPGRVPQVVGAIVIVLLLGTVVGLSVLYSSATGATSRARARLAADQRALASAQARLATETSALAGDQGVGAYLAVTVPGMTQFDQGLRDFLISANDLTGNSTVTAIQTQNAGLAMAKAALVAATVPAGQQAQVSAIESAIQQVQVTFNAAIIAQAGTDTGTQAATTTALVQALQGLASSFSAPLGSVGAG
jgi:hypothetical protein